MSTALRQPTLDLQASPSVCDGRKFTQVDQAVLFGACSTRPLLHQPRLARQSSSASDLASGEPETS